MNQENEKSQTPMDEAMDVEPSSTQGQTADCDRNKTPAVGKVELGSDSRTSKSLKTLLDQQEYEEMRNTSWADLMDEEVIKSKSGSQSTRDDEVGTSKIHDEVATSKIHYEIARSKIQSIESGCIVLSSGDEFPSLSSAAKPSQSDMERRKTGTSKRKQKPKSRFKRSSELTEALAETLKTDSQVRGKLLCRAVKRDKTQRVQALSMTSTDDEEGPTSSKYRKKRRKDVYREETAYEASNLKFDPEDLPHRGAKRCSRESSSGSTSSSIASTLYIKKGWSEPKLGWCKDEAILLRRSKEIEKAKEKPIYAKYLAKVPRHARTKEMPKTPNKYIQYSRRSWDKQVRLWKRRLYEWGDEEPTQSCLSLNESTGDEFSDSEAVSSASKTDENKSSLDEIKVGPDAAASLLGYLDIDTRTNTLTATKTDDESTLKGTSRSVLGPRDFSQL